MVGGTYVCAALILSSAQLHAQASIPDTPAGHALRAWLDAYNSADSARAAALFRTYRVEGNLKGSFAFRGMTGGFDLLSVEVSEPERVEFMIRGRNGPMVGYGAFDLSAADPSRLRTTLFTVGINVSHDAMRIDAPTRARVVNRLAALLDSFYVSPDVGKRMSDTLHARLARGVYDGYANGASFTIRLMSDLDAIAHDKHLQLLYTLLPIGRGPPEPVAQQRGGESESTCGLQKAERLDGNVGYVRFDWFDEPAICAPIIARAMKLLSGSRAVILDLRENSGGGFGTPPLVVSYFVDRRTHLYDMRDRQTGKTLAGWTLDSVAGLCFGGDTPLYVLTSPYTMSAAEELAYDLQSLKRATVVGETTSGQAHVTVQANIEDHFDILLPSGKVTNTATGTDWEGVGVVPDVKVPASEALATAQRLIREKMPH